MKPFSVTLQPYLNEIEVKEGTLRELATMATMENVKGEYTSHVQSVCLTIPSI
jgi:hypothetical protein